jgi:hypothetical protein
MTTMTENEVVREFCYQFAMVLRRMNGKTDEIGLEDLPQAISERTSEAEFSDRLAAVTGQKNA